MRLKEERIEDLAIEVADALLVGEYVDGVPREHLEVIIFNVILRDLQVEDELDDEVREIMKQYQEEMDRGRIPYHKMFKMIKSKLIRERDLII